MIVCKIHYRFTYMYKKLQHKKNVEVKSESVKT